MLRVELKRILKTRATWWLFAIAFVLCIFFAFYTVRLSTYYYKDENGQAQFTRGTEAYELNKEKDSLIEGEITPELISEAVRVYHEVIAEYGDAHNIPPEISGKTLGPYSPVYTWVCRAFSDESGASLAMDITAEQALNFYQDRLLTLERMLEKKYEKQPQVVDYAMSRADSGENFNYSYGIGSTSTFDQLGICIFLVTLICCMITAPIFSSDYASGADDILRCTKRGRRRLGLTKLCGATITSLGVFILCIGAFLVIVYLAFGFNDITSAELLDIVWWTPDSLTAMGCIGLILLLSLLTFLAMSCFTLFLSSRLSSPITVLAVSIAVALIPTVILLTGADGNVLNWVRVCLPSGGVLPSSAMLEELGSLRFLWIGDFVTWSPYVIIVAAAVQIPIWFGLAVRAYNKHEAA